MKYFDWTFDPNNRVGWFLDEPLMSGEVVDAWEFKRCLPFSVKGPPLHCAVYAPGKAVNASFGAFDLLYVRAPVAEVLVRLAPEELQLIPVQVIDSGEQLFLVNVLREIHCIDEARSEFTRWEEHNTARPDKAGQYRSFFKLVIDDSAIGGAHIFRPWGWHMALIVSEVMKTALESVGVEGTIFLPTD